MKYIITLALLSFVLHIFAQQVPNGSFESWSGSVPTDWNTINEVTNTSKVTGQTGFAAKMETKNMIFVGAVPGLLTLGEFNSSTRQITGGISFTQRPDSLVGYYRCGIVSGDTASIAAGFFNGNDTIGKSSLYISQSTSTFKRFAIAINYTQSVNPDLLNIIMLSSFAGDKKVGTWLEVDELEFIYAPSGNDLTVTIDPANSGTVEVTEGGNVQSEPYNFSDNTQLTLTATPNTGYNFVSWTINGSNNSTDNPLNYTITQNSTIQANFEPVSVTNYTITINDNPTSSSTLIVKKDNITQTPPYSFPEGSNIQIEAVPNSGYVFNHWDINGNNQNTNPYSFTLNEDKNITAYLDAVSNQYTLTIADNPTSSSTLIVKKDNINQTPPYVFEEGSSIEIEVVPNSGYTFNHWDINGNTENNNPHTFTMDGNKSVTAYLDVVIPQYTITINEDPANSATIILKKDNITQTPPYTFDEGSSIEIEAIPNSGFTFNHWDIDGNSELTNPFSFSLDSDKNIVAHLDSMDCIPISLFPYLEDFETTDTLPECWEIVDNIGNGQIWLIGSFSSGLQGNTGNYVYLDSDGYGNNNEQNSDVITPVFDFTSKTNVTVEFDHYFKNYQSSSGTFSYSIDGGTTWVDIDSWSPVSTSNPSHFSETIDAISGKNNVIFKFNYSGFFAYHWCFDNFAVSAEQGYEVNLSSNDTVMGTVSPDGVSAYAQNESVTITATPQTGYTFAYWEEADTILSTNKIYTFNINSDREIVGVFQTCGTISTLPFTETFDVANTLPECWSIEDNQGNGQVWEIGTFVAGINGTGTNYAYINSDTYGQNNTQNTDLISPVFDFSYFVDVNLSFDHYYRHFTGSSATLYYSIDAGSTWQVLEQYSATTSNSTAYNETLNQLDGESSVQFKWNYTGTYAYYWCIDNIEITGTPVFEIAAEANPIAGGTITGSGMYFENDTARLEATSAIGYEFENWTENGNIISTDSTISFVVTDHRFLTANFVQYHTLALDKNPQNGGTVTGEGVYQHNEQVTISAVANSGYVFTNWTSNGNIVSSQVSYSFQIVSDSTITANFVKEVELTLLANPQNGGTLTQSGSGLYHEGEQVTVYASPAANYGFIDWTINGNSVSTDTAFTFVITQDTTITANFDGCAGINTYPYTEAFDLAPDCWDVIDYEGNGEEWTFGNNGQITWASGNYAYINSEEFGTWTDQHAVLISIPFDFSNLQNVEVSFTHMFKKSTITTTTGVFAYSTNDGNTWTTIRTWDATMTNSEYYSTEIPALAGKSNVIFKWDYIGGSRPLSSGAWYVDDFSIMEVISGISNNTVNNTIQAYPNPIIDNYYLKSDKTIQLVRIFNNNGQLVYTIEPYNTFVEINLSSLPKGMYYANITINNEVINRKIVKK